MTNKSAQPRSATGCQSRGPAPTHTHTHTQARAHTRTHPAHTHGVANHTHKRMANKCAQPHEAPDCQSKGPVHTHTHALTHTQTHTHTHAVLQISPHSRMQHQTARAKGQQISPHSRIQHLTARTHAHSQTHTRGDTSHAQKCEQ